MTRKEQVDTLKVGDVLVAGGNKYVIWSVTTLGFLVTSTSNGASSVFYTRSSIDTGTWILPRVMTQKEKECADFLTANGFTVS